MKGGLGVLSIGTAPPRARRTEGMRYIVKPENKISAEKRKTAQRALQRGVQPPVKNRGEITKTSETSAGQRNQDRRGFVVLHKLQSKPPDNTSRVYPNITSCFQPNQSYVYHNEIRLLPKPTSGMSKVILKEFLQHKIQLVF